MRPVHPANEAGRSASAAGGASGTPSMKTLVQLSLCISLVGLLANELLAQEEIAPDKLPPKVAEALKARFPGAKIVKATKEMENNEVVYDIEMTVNGKKHEMDCKEDGT